MRESTRYGIGFAKLLPTLLWCQQWDLQADIIDPQNRQFSRDQDFLVHGQQVFTHDFTLSNSGGETIYIKVVGFWTPEYLQEKYRRLEKFANSRQGSKRHWLLMFDRPPTKAKEELFESLRLPSIILSKNKKPTDWIRLAFEERP